MAMVVTVVMVRVLYISWRGGGRWGVNWGNSLVLSHRQASTTCGAIQARPTGSKRGGCKRWRWWWRGGLVVIAVATVAAAAATAGSSGSSGCRVLYIN